jgi:hypothetical protein
MARKRYTDEQIAFALRLELTRFRGRLAGRDQLFSAMALASYSMGER